MNTTATLTIEEISKAITDIAQDYPIKRASLFGSYANGKATEDSDVDILMEFLTPTVSLFLILEIRYRIQELLKKNVDVIHGPLSKDAMIRIDREVPLYES
ncbi:MAG: nucleotidyltransferase domain-containing protein [Firmicutes bacterium]|nr:nucleotidyltransferase domain-containing protein [Bacillota bacterium]